MRTIERREGEYHGRPARAGAFAHDTSRVEAATTANITLSGAQTIDTVAVTRGDLVLVKDQNTASENGVYRVNSGAWKKFKQPDYVAVLGGSANMLKWFYHVAANTYLASPSAVKAATTANITLSGAQTIDGISIVAGDFVLVKDQSTASQNGLYRCQSSTWLKLGQPDFMAVTTGTTNGQTNLYLTSANTYTAAAVASVNTANAASTANVATLSGTTAMDGVSLAVGDQALLKNQSTASQNGLYIIKSSTWVKVGQPKAVCVLNGTVSARLIYLLTTSNTYQANYSVLA